MGGCALFEESSQWPSTADGNDLPPLQAPPDAIVLEIRQVRRLTDDPLVGDALWSEVNQVTANDDTRWQRMHQNGFRLGVAASRPPEALIKLLEAPTANPLAANEPQQLQQRTIAVRNETTTEIEASPFIASCNITTGTGDEQQVLEFKNAKGWYFLKARKTQEGWVELEFTPSIQHGTSKLRPTAAASGGYQLQNGRISKTFHSERFSVKVMVGEWVVLGADPDRPDTLGYQFYLGSEKDDGQIQAYRRIVKKNAAAARFTDEPEEKPKPLPPADGESQFQRLLIIRVANIKPAIVR